MAKKSADAFRTISEVSEALDTPAHVLRFWESKFSQIKPVKRAGGRRYYRPDDIDLLSGIKMLLHEQGMTIKGAQKLLREKGIKHVAALAPLSRGEEDPAPVIDAKPTPAAAIIETSAPAPVEEVEDIPSLPFDEPAKAVATATSPELPSLADFASPVGESLLASFAGTSAARLSGKTASLTPILSKLEALHERMQAR